MAKSIELALANLQVTAVVNVLPTLLSKDDCEETLDVVAMILPLKLLNPPLFGFASAVGNMTRSIFLPSSSRVPL